MSDGIKVGARVEITGKGLQGVVSFIGATMFASGKWIGVALDEPLGKNDGSVQGKRYFTCGLNHGVFVRPPQVQVLASPPAVKKFGSELQPPSAIKRPSTGDHRSSSPSRLPSRLQTPSSLQKPKAGLNRPFAPKEMSSAPAVSEPEVPIVPEPVTVQAPVSPEPAPVQKFSYSAAPTLAPGISMVEIDSLKGQVKEWKEKYETIRIKRQEDRAKLKDFEKMRIHIQQLSDNKIRASEQIQELSKQLREAKKAAEEAVESKEHYVEEMADVHETIEMATLDKEMAEEKADILQKEVDNLTDKVEELQTDLEIMKAEIEESGTDGAVNNYQVKQLEDQNTKLKEALVRMRDLSTAEKAEYSKLEKQLEKKEKEWKEVTTKKDKIADQLTKAETTVDELKEQVDAAHAAEEMVETLTDKNLEQEEKIMDMEEQIHDLESMNEMNEELQESARENELELREELDLMRAKALEAQRQTEAANEVVADYQDTIQKFRKVVQDLQEANHELRTAQSEQEDKSDVESLVSQPPAFNYQIKMVESKFRHLDDMLHYLPSSPKAGQHKSQLMHWSNRLHTEAAARSIDHDLRKLEVSQANLRADLLSMFMPATFTRRGGDSDCVQVLLLVERLACKAKVIAKHVGEKFDTTANIVEGNELLGVRGEQLSFATSLICRLKGLEVLLEQYREALGKCSVERFQRIGTLFSEMLPHERVLEFLADLLRKDTLDETTNVSGLDKAIEFFQHLFNVHMSQEKFDCTKLMEQHLEQTQEVFSALSVNTYRLKSFLQVGQETSDVSILLKDIRTSCDDIRQFCKKVKRRMPQSSTNNSATRLEFAQEVKERLVQSFSSLASVNNIAYDWVMECSRRSGRAESSALPSRVMQEFFYKAASKVLEGKESSFSDAVRMSLGSVMATMNSLVTAMQEGEYDCNDPLPKIIAPIEKRAEAVKSEMTDSEGLTSKLEEKDETLNELRKVLKTKNDDISETKIRTGMLERKLEKANKEGSEKASVLQQRLDSMTEEVKKKEREYDETLDSLQNDIDTLEAEKFELKQRLAAQTKQRGALSDLAFKAPSLGATSGLASLLAGAAGATTTVSDSPLLTEQIKLLRTALRVKSIECSYLTGEKIMKELKELTPLNVPKLTPRSQDDVSKLKSDLGKLSETLTSLAIPKVIDISKRRAGSYPVGSSSPYEKLHDQQWKVRMAADRVQNLKLKVQQVLAKQGNKQVQSDFASFPTPQFVKSLSKSKPELIGNLRINDKSGKNNGHAIFLNLDQFKELHSIMYARSIR